MSPMTSPERTETRSLGLLSSRVSQELNAIIRHRSLPTEEERRLLEGGVRLLERFVDGSRLVEGDVKSGMVPGPDSLRGFQQALGTLTALSIGGKKKIVSERFQTLRDELKHVCEADSTEALRTAQLEGLSSFFTTLATMFFDDLAATNLEEAAPHTQNPSRESPGGESGVGLRR